MVLTILSITSTFPKPLVTIQPFWTRSSESLNIFLCIIQFVNLCITKCLIMCTSNPLFTMIALISTPLNITAIFWIPKRKNDSFARKTWLRHWYRQNYTKCRYIRKTPNLVDSTGALSEALMLSPRTRRVSTGSMTPSSHNLKTNIIKAFSIIITSILLNCSSYLR